MSTLPSSARFGFIGPAKTNRRIISDAPECCRGLPCLVRTGVRCMFSARWSGAGRYQLCEFFSYCLCIVRPNQAADLTPIPNEYEGGPQFDSERAPQRSAFTVLDLDVRHVLVRCKSFSN